MKPLIIILLSISMTLLLASCIKDQSCEHCFDNGRPPVAVAGNDLNTVLPEDSILLNANASYVIGGSLVEYSWKKISGPASFFIVNDKSAQTMVRSLVEGVYQFELTVKDEKNQIAKDSIRVTVKPDPRPHNEIIYTDLEWYFWHDPNDNSNSFDEIYLSVSDIANQIPDLAGPNLKIYVKRDSTANWELANALTSNGNCVPPYYFILQPLVLLIELCPLDYGLIGKKGAVRVVY